MSADLIKKASVIVAVSMANWEQVWKIAHDCQGGTPEEQNHLDRLAEDCRLEALLLLSLQRSLDGSDSEARSLLPITSALAASYSMIALAIEAEEIPLDLLLRPKEMQSLLGQAGAELINEYGKEEALRRLQDD